MSHRQLRNVSTFCLCLGIAFLIIGFAIFFASDVGTKPEKMGNFFMILGAVLLGVGFTALITKKSL